MRQDRAATLRTHRDAPPRNPFFDPQGVAVVGASRNPKKLGYGVVRNLVNHGYKGAIYPVNPAADEILEHACYPSVAEIPDPVDLAVIVLPAAAAVDAVDQCGARGIRHVIVVSGGFGELGAEGAAHEEALARTAEKHKMRVLGPNCIGIIDAHTPLNTTFVVGMPQVGDIAFVSQSGAMGAVVIDWAQGAGIGFSRIISLGNQVDVNESEILAILADDPNTRVVTLYIEGVAADGGTFMRAAQEAARRKPLILLKGGRTKGGAKAVASHTGALAGSVEAYDAALRRSGVLQARTTEELFDWARALAWQPLPQGDGVAVLTNAGGPGIVAVDALEAAGLRLAPLTDETKARLRPHLPHAASVNNPIDVLAGSGPDIYATALHALLLDPTVDAVLVIMAPNDWFTPESLAQVIADAAQTSQKPVLASLMGQASLKGAQEILRQRGVPNFAFPERAGPVLAAMLARQRWLNTPVETPSSLTDVDRSAARAALDQGDFGAALAAYGINLPTTRQAADANQAVRLAEEIGYPVALKLASPQITHKSDVGGIALNLAAEEEVRAAFDRIVNAARVARPDAEAQGALVQKMLNGGQEIIVGAKRDPQFGPLILAGSGGVDVELLRDVATDIAPLSRSQAEQLLDSTLAGRRLKGWRGAPPADRNAALDAMLRLAQIAWDFPQISELEINPLLVMPKGEGAFAVDVRGAFSQ